MTIQWYPGHIAKWDKGLEAQLKLVDVVVEVVDARLPRSTVHPDLRRRVGGKPVLVLLNKADLADPAATRAWVKALKAAGDEVQSYSTRTAQTKKPLIQALLRLGEGVLAKRVQRGLKPRPVRVMMVGMPNVGKSSVINHIAGQKKAHTGHQAGVTRQAQWVRIHPQVELLDSPGVIPMRLEDQAAAMRLATVHGIGEAAFEDEAVAAFLLEELEAQYPGLLATHYELGASVLPTLATLGERRHDKTSGGDLDLRRTATALLTDFRHGRLGPITLEHPTQ